MSDIHNLSDYEGPTRGLTGQQIMSIARLDTHPIKADWALYERELEAMLGAR